MCHVVVILPSAVGGYEGWEDDGLPLPPLNQGDAEYGGGAAEAA